jgi:TonB family protein
MLRYLINYFVARTTYDAVYRVSARNAQRRAAANYQHALVNADLQARRNYVPPIDDNMVNAGRHHAPLGSTEDFVEKCYGPRLSEHERKNAHGSGITGVVYRIGYFDVGVEFEKDRSVRECWVKNTRAPSEGITGGEMNAIMDNKAYGPGWERLENSSETRLWYRSESGLIACCDWNSPIAGGCALTIFDPRAGTPEGLPPLPPARAALPAPKVRKQANGCLIALVIVIGVIMLPGLIRNITTPEAGRRTTSSPAPAPTASYSNPPTPLVVPVPSATASAAAALPAPPASIPLAPTSPTTSGSSRQQRKIVYAPQPSYPFAAKQARLRGTGRFRIKFSADGRALGVDIVRSTGSSVLDQAALSTLSRWRAQVSSEDSSIIVPITFSPPER